MRFILLAIFLALANHSLLAEEDLASQRILWTGTIGTIVAVPLMIALGTFLANPHWAAIEDIPDGTARSRYIKNSTSALTIPISAIFAILGTAPMLLSFLRAEDE